MITTRGYDRVRDCLTDFQIAHLAVYSWDWLAKRGLPCWCAMLVDLLITPANFSNRSGG